jgi:phosphorylcholine metabolism protein LicD
MTQDIKKNDKRKKLVFACVVLLFIVLFFIYKQSTIKHPDSFDSRLYNIMPQATVNKLYTILKLVHCIFEKTKTPYSMIGGTLLGAIRQKSIIPWDYDVDIVVFTNTYEEVMAILKPLESKGIICYLNENKGILKVQFKDYTAILDIFRLEEVAYGNGIKYEFIHPYKNKYVNEYFLNGELFPLQLYQFGPLKLYGPNKPNLYLDRAYPNWNKSAVAYNTLITKQITRDSNIEKDALKAIVMPDFLLPATCK